MWAGNSPRISPAVGRQRAAPACASLATTTSTCSASQPDSAVDGGLYARAWRFVQRRLHLRPRASSCPAAMAPRAENPAASATSGSYTPQWQRVHVLRELEEAGERAQRRLQRPEPRPEAIQEAGEPCAGAQDGHRAPRRTRTRRKAAQATCANCGTLFFPALADARDPSAFCSRDCQSSFQYLAALQAVHAAAESDAWTSSAM